MDFDFDFDFDLTVSKTTKSVSLSNDKTDWNKITWWLAISSGTNTEQLIPLFNVDLLISLLARDFEASVGVWGDKEDDAEDDDGVDDCGKMVKLDEKDLLLKEKKRKKFK